jgi:hypothetical protein
MVISITPLEAAVPYNIRKTINKVNKDGPYLGIVVPNAFEMNPTTTRRGYTKTIFSCSKFI